MRHHIRLAIALAAAALSSFFLLPSSFLSASVTIVPRPPTATTSAHYTNNRPPLLPASFIALPPGSIRARGWLLEILNRQRDGLAGHLGEVSAWLQKDDNAWLSKTGQGKYGWEELPYWLKGYLLLGYALDDQRILDEAQVWIEGTLASQRPDGDFGPDRRFDDDGTRDYWANMLMLFTLQSYYEHTADPRVLALMTRYFHYQLAVPDKKFLTHYWQRMRGGDNLYSVYWLYNRTGDPKLLDLASKIHRCTADWEQPGTLPNWHNVNIAECFREPATHWLQTHDEKELRATYANFAEIRRRYGQVPGGMYGGDENSRPGYTDPHQAVETCGMVEQMLSDQLLMQMTGDPFWADNCEDVAFNTYPAALTADMRALRYLTAPNMVVSDAKNHAPGVQNRGPFFMMNPFSQRCCQHNHSMGWPYYAKHLWLATPDNGLCAALYSASEVTAQVGPAESSATVRIAAETNYPFDETITFKIKVMGASSSQTVTFPLYLRLPAWCATPALAINGEKIPVGASLATPSASPATSGATPSVSSATSYPVAAAAFTPSSPDAAPTSADTRGSAQSKIVSSASDSPPNPKSKIPAAATARYLRIERAWRGGDTITLTLPMTITTRRWTENKNSLSVNYGPLTFSLKIGERYNQRDSAETALKKSSQWQPNVDKTKWPSYEILPTTPWNYGLLATTPADFTLKKLPWPANNYPFTPDAVPFQLTTRAKKIPQWKLDQHGLAGALQPSPVKSTEPPETVTLIPMGAARLRISAFPVIGAPPAAHAWQ